MGQPFCFARFDYHFASFHLQYSFHFIRIRRAVLSFHLARRFERARVWVRSRTCALHALLALSRLAIRVLAFPTVAHPDRHEQNDGQIPMTTDNAEGTALHPWLSCGLTRTMVTTITMPAWPPPSPRCSAATWYSPPSSPFSPASVLAQSAAGCSSLPHGAPASNSSSSRYPTWESKSARGSRRQDSTRPARPGSWREWLACHTILI